MIKAVPVGAAFFVLAPVVDKISPFDVNKNLFDQNPLVPDKLLLS